MDKSCSKLIHNAKRAFCTATRHIYNYLCFVHVCTQLVCTTYVRIRMYVCGSQCQWQQQCQAQAQALPGPGPAQAQGSASHPSASAVAVQGSASHPSASAVAVPVVPAAPWRRGAVAPWRRGAVAPWRRGAVAPWRRGAVAPWRRGAVAPWRRGAVAPWRRGVSTTTTLDLVIRLISQTLHNIDIVIVLYRPQYSACIYRLYIPIRRYYNLYRHMLTRSWCKQ